MTRITALALIALQLLSVTTEAAYVPDVAHLAQRSSGPAGCQKLEEAFPGKVFRNNASMYNFESTDFYSSSASLSPGCVFVPTSPQDVAQGIKILAKSQTPFAVRGGGHMPIAGAANVDGHGALIGMDKLSTVKLSEFKGTQVAIVESGTRWGLVYAALAEKNLTVTGGRYYPVGVGGLPLGGGISYYNSARGWTANNIVNCEVVTADGKVINVNAQSSPDLFWALKGGSNNFAVVTKYYMKTFPLHPIYAGFISNAEKDNGKLVNAIEAFCNPETGGILDSKAALDTNLFYDSTSGSITGLTSIFYNGTGPTPAFKDFTSLPSTYSTVANRGLVEWEGETTIYGASAARKLWTAISVKSNAAGVRLAGDVYLDAIRANNASLMQVANGSFTVTWQPMAASAMQQARAAGGDPIDLDPADGPVILMLYAASYVGAQHDNFVDKFLKNITYTLEAKSKQQGLYYPYIYLNDAGGFQQNTLSLYGKGKSLPKMKQIAEKYDPQGVFQRLLHGAFKLDGANLGT